MKINNMAFQCVCVSLYNMLQVNFDFTLILIYPKLILNFLCLLGLGDKGIENQPTLNQN